ncbi:MAG: divergent PAP2 family protein [Clostridia bacterium]|nr:divergent PAP2 family protein [Clostridia bacterium]
MLNFGDLFTNRYLIVPVVSWLTAQILKVFTNAIVTKKIDFKRLFGDGGMPSAHSATVSSLAVTSLLTAGFGSFEFAFSFIFATIVCRDAMGVRFETGKQSILLNEIVDSFELISKEELPEVKLKELVGHTPFQVIAGILLGCTIAIVFYAIFPV